MTCDAAARMSVVDAMAASFDRRDVGVPLPAMDPHDLTATMDSVRQVRLSSPNVRCSKNEPIR